MRLDDKSLKIVNSSNPPSAFHVTISDNTISIDSPADDKIYGDILLYSSDIDTAFDFVMEYKDSMDYLFFMSPNGNNVQIIAEPEKKMPLIEDVFKKIKNILSDFEERKEQIKLAKKIKYCLDNGINGLFEAPTGTGKSIAYLIPSVIYAKELKKKVIISTNTINLQRQLIEKDLPILHSIMDFKAETALGRSNYLCKRKLDNLLIKGNIFIFEKDVYKTLMEFVKRTTNGLKSELFNSKRGIDENIWESIASNSLSCAHAKCPYYKNRCFYYRAKTALESADIIIANHHIVLSDALMKDAGVLPDYSAIIFDEAHNLEKNATSYFTKTVSTSELKSYLNRLFSKNKKRKSGLLSEVAESEELAQTIDEIEKAKNVIDYEVSSFKDSTNEIVVDNLNVKTIKPKIKNLENALLNVEMKLKKWKDNVDITAVAQSILENIDMLNLFLEETDNDSVRWIKKNVNYIHFNITPLSISQSLQENVYNRTESSIFTSATISINKSFDFFKKTVGIEQAEEFIAQNNFDYNSVSKMIVIKDAPQPNSYTYIDNLSKNIINLAGAIKNTNIGSLVLFTSYRMLNGVYDKVYEYLEALGFGVLRQGDFDNFETLKEFKKNKSFLFATNSFWEGIDVKGDALSIVFITRLPFEVPNTPVEKSRYTLMETQGINPFFEYSLPKAVLKFKQGFGRLIRDKNDKGIVIVSDSRIVAKPYGKMFIDALPKIKKEVIRGDEIQNSVCNFFSNC